MPKLSLISLYFFKKAKNITISTLIKVATKIIGKNITNANQNIKIINIYFIYSDIGMNAEQ